MATSREYIEGNFFKKYEVDNSCRASASLCSYSALVRSLIAYADFLTMAAIALVTCVGFVLPEFFRRIARTSIAISACVLIWLLSFAIISPVVFGIDLLGYSFGRFGWDSVWGRCNLTHLELETKSHGFIYQCAILITFIVIVIRYINEHLFAIISLNLAMPHWLFATRDPTDW